jgi:hypothetical protein
MAASGSGVVFPKRLRSKVVVNSVVKLGYSKVGCAEYVVCTHRNYSQIYGRSFETCSETSPNSYAPANTRGNIRLSTDPVPKGTVEYHRRRKREIDRKNRPLRGWVRVFDRSPKTRGSSEDRDGGRGMHLACRYRQPHRNKAIFCHSQIAVHVIPSQFLRKSHQHRPMRTLAHILRSLLSCRVTEATTADKGTHINSVFAPAFFWSHRR